MKKYRVPRQELIAKGEALDNCLTVMLSENMSHEDMVDHVVTLLCAGHDTTAFFSSYLCLLLAQHQHAQEKVYEEIMRVVGDKEEVTADDCAELHYFHKCMQETLRIYSIIPMVSRYASAETQSRKPTSPSLKA
jgi:cytochrome P450